MDDKPFFLPPAQELQLEELWAMTQKDGNEHLAHMRGDVTLKIAHGDDGAVTMGDDQYFENVVKPGDWCLHTHPSLSSFSNGDLYLAAQHNLHLNAAVITHDKSVFYAKPLVDDAFDLEAAWSMAYVMLSKQSRSHLKKAGAVLTPDAFHHAARDSANSQVEMSEAHYLNLWLAKEGLIEYNFRPGDMTKEVFALVKASVLTAAART